MLGWVSLPYRDKGRPFRDTLALAYYEGTATRIGIRLHCPARYTGRFRSPETEEGLPPLPGRASSRTGHISKLWTALLSAPHTLATPKPRTSPPWRGGLVLALSYRSWTSALPTGAVSDCGRPINSVGPRERPREDAREMHPAPYPPGRYSAYFGASIGLPIAWHAHGADLRPGAPRPARPRPRPRTPLRAQAVCAAARVLRATGPARTRTASHPRVASWRRRRSARDRAQIVGGASARFTSVSGACERRVSSLTHPLSRRSLRVASPPPNPSLA